MNNLIIDIPAGQVELLELSDFGNNLTEELSTGLSYCTSVSYHQRKENEHINGATLS